MNAKDDRPFLPTYSPPQPHASKMPTYFEAAAALLSPIPRTDLPSPLPISHCCLVLNIVLVATPAVPYNRRVIGYFLQPVLGRWHCLKSLKRESISDLIVNAKRVLPRTYHLPYCSRWQFPDEIRSLLDCSSNPERPLSVPSRLLSSDRCRPRSCSFESPIASVHLSTFLRLRLQVRKRHVSEEDPRATTTERPGISYAQIPSRPEIMCVLTWEQIVASRLPITLKCAVML